MTAGVLGAAATLIAPVLETDQNPAPSPSATLAGDDGSNGKEKPSPSLPGEGHDDSSGDQEPGSGTPVCEHESSPPKVRGAVYVNPCITMQKDGGIKLSSSFKSSRAREYTLWIWLIDDDGNPVRDVVESCTVNFRESGQEEYCVIGNVTPPHPGQWGAAVDVSTDRVAQPPVWETGYTGTGSGALEWNP